MRANSRIKDRIFFELDDRLFASVLRGAAGFQYCPTCCKSTFDSCASCPCDFRTYGPSATVNNES
jgi:hypothetical protein